MGKASKLTAKRATHAMRIASIRAGYSSSITTGTSIFSPPTHPPWCGQPENTSSGSSTTTATPSPPALAHLSGNGSLPPPTAVGIPPAITSVPAIPPNPNPPMNPLHPTLSSPPILLFSPSPPPPSCLPPPWPLLPPGYIHPSLALITRTLDEAFPAIIHRANRFVLQGDWAMTALDWEALLLNAKLDAVLGYRRDMEMQGFDAFKSVVERQGYREGVLGVAVGFVWMGLGERRDAVAGLGVEKAKSWIGGEGRVEEWRRKVEGVKAVLERELEVVTRYLARGEGCPWV